MFRATTALVLLALAAPAQDPRPADVATVASTVRALYDVISGPAGQKRDWQRMQSLFHADARLVPVLKAADGSARPVLLTVADYVQRSGPFLEQNGFFEQEIAQRTETFGDFAHVWSTYEGRRQKDDKEPFLRGINSIQLVRQQGRWWVLQVVWEQEHDAGPIPAQYLPAPDGWQLVWSDEFAQDGAPDAAKWDSEQGRVRNQELQYYTKGRAANARVEGGVMVLEARREDFEGATFTSASLVTKGRAAFTHARIEVRAKLPRGRGVWPAIWLLGTDIDKVGWPACGEIDVMEYVGFEPDHVFHNVHTGKYNHARGNGRGTRVALAAPYAGFHVYAVEWDAERMHFEVDGVETFAVANEHTGTGAWPFDAPHYLILNVAVGGSWGGQKGIDEAVFPQRMEVDWVRVYARKP